MRTLVLTLGLLLPAGGLLAHSGGRPAADETSPAPVFKLEKLSERVHCLFGQGGNIGLFTTDEGVLVVDSQFREIAPGIVEQIRTVSDKPIKYLVNTHYHGDHTGGNPVFAKLAAIVSHETVRTRMLDLPGVVQKSYPARMKTLEAEIASIKDPDDPYRAALNRDLDVMKFMATVVKDAGPDTMAPPSVTYDGRMAIFFGDQPVEIFHLSPGHTDGDSIVFFRREKVVHMGDLLFNGMVPFIDVPGGGSGAGYLKNLDWALTTLPADTKVIPGHGPVTDMAGLRRHRDFLRDMQAEVRKAVSEGWTRAEAARRVKMDAYPDIKPGFRTLANVVLAFYDEMRPKP